MQARQHELEQEQGALRARKAQQLPPTIEHPDIPPCPEPNLTSTQSHFLSTQARLHELEQEQEALRARKAQQLPPTIEHPDIPPRPEPKPLTVPLPFRLRSEVCLRGSAK